MEFGDLITRDDEEWLVIGIADHEFRVDDLKINWQDSASYFTPSVGYIVVMSWDDDSRLPRGFVTQVRQEE